MDKKDILDQLDGIFQDTFTNGGFEFSEKLARDEVGEWDSLNHIRLLTAIEANFGFQFDLDEIENITGVAAIVDIIHSRGV